MDSMKRLTTGRLRIVCPAALLCGEKLLTITATLPSCPQAIMQFQHGTFTVNADNSLSMSPFGVDGRQLLSDPCSGASTYTRYNQTEHMSVCYTVLNAVFLLMGTRNGQSTKTPTLN
jgi:hypothetical protein